MDFAGRTRVLTLTLIFLVTPAEHERDTVQGSEVIRVSEGSDVILPCSIEESVEQQLFDWRKDGEKKKEVFMYDAGLHYNNGLRDQDDQFRGRVSHFPDQMKFGNASIRINNTKITDSGNYTCYFPRINGGLTFYMKLVVGSVPKPSVTIFNVTDSGVQLKCEVQGAFPKPELRWKDSDGNILDAEEPEISERDGRYHVTLQTTVTSTTTTSFQCVVQQKDLNHETASTITVSEKLFVDTCSKVTIEGFMAGMMAGAILVAAFAALLLDFNCIRISWIRGTKKNKEDEPETKKPLSSDNITV
ncbi:butyrophilin-like protein 2 isoform X1 [Mugil cephalus]|uniref:butyrophilin-like protein 2 isoform X1 n=1 Tax=Mugil cephalus TaxID=48193 RepID=UPI001FB7DEF2|nr:butyrophilin-like protein 2 isoform X1 [Mugil cephalus]